MTSSRPSQEGWAMATDFALFLRRFLTASPGWAARLLTQHDRVLSRHVQAADRLLPRRQIHPARKAHPRAASTPPRSAGSWTGSRTPGTTACRPGTSAWPRSARSTGGCNRRTRPRWPAAKTFSPSPPRSTTQPAVNHLERRADPPSARPARPVHPAGPTRRDLARHPL